jgi:hypothetical protein
MMENEQTEKSGTRGKLIAAIALVLAVVAIALAAKDPKLPPYPSSFTIEWDEEVQIAEKQTIWVHRIEFYQRTSAWSRWDAQKRGEELSFAPTARIGKIDLRLELGAFGGVERMHEDWVIAFAGSNLSSLRIGSCALKGNGMCLMVIKADGTIYKPSNANEIVDNFPPWFRCRTTTEDCYRRFNGGRMTVAAKADYARANPQPIDFPVGVHKGTPYPSTEFSTP